MEDYGVCCFVIGSDTGSADVHRLELAMAGWGIGEGAGDGWGGEGERNEQSES